MRNIEVKNGCLIYYGNPVGYLENGGVVADPLFRREDLEGWLGRRSLPVQWVDGVYDRLANGGCQSATEGGAPLKFCRIWQMGPDTPIEMRFVGLDRMTAEYGGPDPARYRVAFDGQLESNDLEHIWNKFCRKPLAGGDHPLAISDVIELYDASGSEFYYVDRRTIVPIEFGSQEQAAGMTMTI